MTLQTKTESYYNHTIHYQSVRFCVCGNVLFCFVFFFLFVLFNHNHVGFYPTTQLGICLIKFWRVRRLFIACVHNKSVPINYTSHRMLPGGPRWENILSPRRVYTFNHESKNKVYERLNLVKVWTANIGLSWINWD